MSFNNMNSLFPKRIFYVFTSPHHSGTLVANNHMGLIHASFDNLEARYSAGVHWNASPFHSMKQCQSIPVRNLAFHLLSFTKLEQK